MLQLILQQTETTNRGEPLSRTSSFLCTLAFSVMVTAQPIVVHAQQIGKSGLPLPRYVSLKSDKVNMRVGPGKQFKVDWQYMRAGLPIEILQEYENWRKVRDHEGNEGWIATALLSSDRTAVIRPWEKDREKGLVSLYASMEKSSRVIAKIEPGAISMIQSCDEQWCRIIIQELDGYVTKNTLWGVYPDEKIN